MKKSRQKQKFGNLIELTRALKFDNGNRTFHTTFILKGKKILSIGINTLKTHPKTLELDYIGRVGTHSELNSIIKLGREDCSDLTFVNIRLLKDSSIGLSKPCPGCMSLLNQVGFKKVFYSDPYGNFQTL